MLELFFCVATLLVLSDCKGHCVRHFYCLLLGVEVGVASDIVSCVDPQFS